MRPFHFTLIIILALTAGLSLRADIVKIPNGIEHTDWDLLLQQYVDKDGLVDYAGWHQSKEDRRRLDVYLAQFAKIGLEPDQQPLDYRVAALNNLYNALTIQWMLENFPVESIRKTDNPWKKARHPVGGRLVTLDEVEHETLRPDISWKVHSMVVCAARSCPPLLDRAFLPETWEAQMEERYRSWFARVDLNTFNRESKTVTISKIFDWYGEDFTGEDSLREVIRRYAPESEQAWLKETKFRIRYMDYHWGLNAQSDIGKDFKNSWFF